MIVLLEAVVFLGLLGVELFLILMSYLKSISDLRVVFYLEILGEIQQDLMILLRILGKW